MFSIRAWEALIFAIRASRIARRAFNSGFGRSSSPASSACAFALASVSARAASTCSDLCLARSAACAAALRSSIVSGVSGPVSVSAGVGQAPLSRRAFSWASFYRCAGVFDDGCLTTFGCVAAFSASTIFLCSAHCSAVHLTSSPLTDNLRFSNSNGSLGLNRDRSFDR